MHMRRYILLRLSTTHTRIRALRHWLCTPLYISSYHQFPHIAQNPELCPLSSADQVHTDEARNIRRPTSRVVFNSHFFQVKLAGDHALEAYKLDHPDINEEELKVDFPKAPVINAHRPAIDLEAPQPGDGLQEFLEDVYLRLWARMGRPIGVDEARAEARRYLDRDMEERRAERERGRGMGRGRGGGGKKRGKGKR